MTNVETIHENTPDGQETRRVVTLEDATGATTQYTFIVEDGEHVPADGEEPTRAAWNALEPFQEDEQ